MFYSSNISHNYAVGPEAEQAGAEANAAGHDVIGHNILGH